MSRTPARTSRPVPDPSNPTTPPQHPALGLLYALNALHGVCLNADSFRDLADRRKLARNAHQTCSEILAKAANKRAAELSRQGASMEEMDRVFSAFVEHQSAEPPWNVPAEYTKSLGDMVARGQMYCDRALESIRAGGAKGLDAASGPDASGKAPSIELHTKLQEAERLFNGLSIGVREPRFLIDDDAVKMADLGQWCTRKCDDLIAVIETRGLDAPPSASTEAGKATPRPKTRRGIQKLAATSAKDLSIIADLNSGVSYRDTAKRNGVSKSTVGRVAEANGLTGHAPDAVPLGGTLQEKLSIRGKSGKHRGK